jgi:hypothetical protein
MSRSLADTNAPETHTRRPLTDYLDEVVECGWRAVKA